MYFKLTAANIDHNIVANDASDAIVIGHALYPHVPLTITQITHQEFHENHN
jgi:hypothetical protein